ncbi:MAG: penicillin-binding protein [Vicingaceae bacterium]
MSNDKKDILRRVYIVYGLLLLFGVAVFFQAFNVQVVQGKDWKQKAENLTLKYKNIEAVRGNIYSSDGSLLATSVPIYEVRFDPNVESLTDEIFYKEIDSLSLMLSSLFKDKSKYDYKKELVNARKKGSRYHLIKRNVKYTDLKKIKRFPIFRRGKYKGGLVYIQKNKRVRPFKILAARTIGYEREGIKPVGLEGAYSAYLKGVNGKRLMQKIAGGIWMPINDENEIEPIDGSDIYTTIDVNVQDVAENALLTQLEMHQADHGCVVLMEVATGEIKAIANLKRTSNGDYYESYNYSIGESTEPGSTFKLPALVAALEDGLIDIDDMVDTEDGTTKFYDAVMRDSHRGGYGKITVKRAFEVSSNVGVSKLIWRAYSKNPQKFVDRLYSMSLNKPLGIEIAGEGQPLIKNTTSKSWSGTTLPWMSIGYEVRMTPLQILTFYNAIANNGKMVKPKFVKYIQSRGKKIEEIKTEVINPKICSEQTVKKAKEMLEGVVENGTAVNLKNSIYKIAGKTGTAQIANDKYGYYSKSGKSYQASFVGYFPANNPKYTCIVVVNAPSRDVYYGNLVAGPIFKEVADKIYATSLNIHKPLTQKEYKAKSPIPYAKNGDKEELVKIYQSLQIPFVIKDESANWVKTSTKTDKVEILKHTITPIYIPDVVGMSLKDAVYILENKGLQVTFEGVGVVKSQSVLPGEKIVKNQKIHLELS